MDPDEEIIPFPDKMASRWGTALLSRLLIEPVGIKELWIAAGGGTGWVAVTPEAVDGGGY